MEQQDTVFEIGNHVQITGYGCVTQGINEHRTIP